MFAPFDLETNRLVTEGSDVQSSVRRGWDVHCLYDGCMCFVYVNCIGTCGSSFE